MAKSAVASPRSFAIFLFTLTAAVFVWCSLLWLLGEAAAVVFAHRVMHIGVLDMASVSYHLSTHWSDPAQAWPPEARAQLPGPVGFYLVSAVVLTVILLAVVGVMALTWDLEVEDGLVRRKSSKNKRPAAVWAGRRDVRELR